MFFHTRTNASIIVVVGRLPAATPIATMIVVDVEPPACRFSRSSPATTCTPSGVPVAPPAAWSRAARACSPVVAVVA